MPLHWELVRFQEKKLCPRFLFTLGLIYLPFSKVVYLLIGFLPHLSQPKVYMYAQISINKAALHQL